MNKITFAVSSFILEQNVNYNTLIGPSGVDMYKFKNKLIIFFRDVHQDPDKKCVGGINFIDEFLDKLFELSPIRIDFFSETAMFLQSNNNEFLQNIISEILKYPPRNFGIEKIFYKFIHCFTSLKSDCNKYENVMFHNLSFRIFPRSRYNIKGGIFDFPLFYLTCPGTECKFMPSQDYKDNVSKEKLDGVMEKYYGSLESFHLKFFDELMKGEMGNLRVLIHQHLTEFKEYISSTMIEAFDDNKDGFYKDPVYNEFHEQFKKLNENDKKELNEFIVQRYHNNVGTLISEIRTLIQNKYTNIFGKANRIILEFANIIMDAYALICLLIAIKNYENSSIIILYAGNEHVKCYLDYLKKLGTDFEHIAGINSTVSYEKPIGCIDILKEKEKENDNWNKILLHLQEKLLAPLTPVSSSASFIINQRNPVQTELCGGKYLFYKEYKNVKNDYFCLNNHSLDLNNQ